MVGTYDGWLVLLSIVVAIMASFVALDLATRLTASRERKSARYWLIGGAAAMGTGIWSMHFIGMLAYRLPVPMAYDVSITLLSLLIAVVLSGFALYSVSRAEFGKGRLLRGGVLMGLGIISIHYVGMAAMQMQPPIRYQPYLVLLSIVIAVAASLVALWSAFTLRFETILSAFWKKAGSAFVMGTAIYGMHYTGMTAAIFAPNSICTVSPQNINNTWLAVVLGGAILLFLVATLLVSSWDAYFAALSMKHAEALRQAHDSLETSVMERTAELMRAEQRLRQALEERERLARDLHDNIVQRIYAIGMRLEESQRLIRERPQDATTQIASAIVGLNEVIRKVRQYIAGSGQQIISGAQLRVELAELVKTIGPDGPPRFRLSVDPTAVERLTSDEAENLLQIAREALSNAVRHSHGQHGELALRLADGDVLLEVSDDGVGFDPQASRQKDGGLRNMESRARQIGADLEILSSPNGTRIIVHVRREKKGR